MSHVSIHPSFDAKVLCYIMLLLKVNNFEGCRSVYQGTKYRSAITKAMDTIKRSKNSIRYTYSFKCFNSLHYKLLLVLR